MSTEIFRDQSFSPEITQMLCEAFDTAWQAIHAEVPPNQMQDQREALARTILDMARRVEYPADVLARHAVEKAKGQRAR